MTEALTGDADQPAPERVKVDPRREMLLHRPDDRGLHQRESLPLWSTLALFVMMLMVCNLIAAMLIGFWVVSTATPYGSLFGNDFAVWTGINIAAVSLSAAVAVSIQRRH